MREERMPMGAANNKRVKEARAAEINGSGATRASIYVRVEHESVSFDFFRLIAGG